MKVVLTFAKQKQLFIPIASDLEFGSSFRKIHRSFILANSLDEILFDQAEWVRPRRVQWNPTSAMRQGRERGKFP